MKRLIIVCGLFLVALIIVDVQLAGSPDRPVKIYHTNVEGDHPIRSLAQWNGYCGKERGDVKHTVDLLSANIPTTPIRTTVPKLDAMQVPSGLHGPDTTRLPEESHVYKITGTLLTIIKTESDGDLHMVLRSTLDPSKTMIAESIPPSCAQTSRFLYAISVARTAVEGMRNSLPRKVTITGIGYFDFNHGQTGVAPNAIELHPILSIQ